MIQIFAVGVQLFTLAVLAATAFIILTRLRSTKREYYILFLFAGIIYVLGEIFSISAISADGAFFSLMLMFLGGILSGPLFLAFILKYLGYNFPKAVKSLVFTVAFLLIAFIWASPWHDLFYVYIYLYPDGTGPTISQYGVVRGVLYPLVTTHIIIYMLVPMAILLREAFRPGSIHIKKLVILLFCATVPGLTHGLYFFQLNVHGLYPSMFFTPLGSVLIYFVILKYDLLENEKEREVLEQIRTAEERAVLMLETMPLACFMTKRVKAAPGEPDFIAIDCNQAAVDLFGFKNKQDAIENYHSIIPKLDENPEVAQHAHDEATVAFKGGNRLKYTFVDTSGSIIPCEVTMLPTIYRGEPVLANYKRDLREVIATVESLKRADAAEEESQAKSRFLARMSHEIRTPITAVLGISEMQLRGQTMPPHTEEAFSKIYASSKTLLHIVNDILDFSRIESGKMSITMNEYNVADLVSETSSLHLIYLEQKDVSLELHVDANLPAKLIGDALRVRQIITNLLSNAFKFTESGKVVFSLQCEKIAGGHATIAISVQDTGVGMSAEQMEMINNEYTRFHEREKPYVSGTGLGLSIVYTLAKLMDAQFDLQSEDGKGTHAVVRIRQEVSGEEILGEELAARLQNFEVGGWSVAEELAFKPTQLPHGKVLVVDDVETNLHVTETMLEAFGLTIELCTNGGDAVEKIRQGNVYDVIFMDHMMPGMDGVEATKILRDMGYDKPIVALTANALKGQAEMFIQNGFSGFMSKPVDIKILNAYLMRFVGIV